MATLHFPTSGEVLTVLARKHADCTGVKVEGPFRPTRTTSTSCRNSSMRTGRNYTFLACTPCGAAGRGDCGIHMPKSRKWFVPSSHPRCKRVSDHKKRRVRLRKQRHRLETPRSRGVGTLGVTGPLAASFRGLWVSGIPSPGNGGQDRSAAKSRTDHATKGADSELTGWHPEETGSLVTATQLTRGTLETAWVASVHKGQGPRRPQRA